MRPRPTEEETRFQELILPIMEQLEQMFPLLNRTILAKYQNREIPHVRFSKRQLLNPLLIQIFENAKDIQDPRTYSAHGAQHRVYEDVLSDLIRELRQNPLNITAEFSDVVRESRQLPSRRLAITTQQPLNTHQKQAIWPVFGQELAQLDRKHRERTLRQVARDYGAGFAILAGFYAGLTKDDTIQVLQKGNLQDTILPTRNRYVRIGNNRVNDHSFFEYLYQELLSAEGRLTVVPEKQEHIHELIAQHPVWGSSKQMLALRSAYFAMQYHPLAILNSANDQVEFMAQRQGIDLSNPNLAKYLNQHTGGYWVSMVITAYREYLPLQSGDLTSNSAEGLRRLLAGLEDGGR